MKKVIYVKETQEEKVTMIIKWKKKKKKKKCNHPLYYVWAVITIIIAVLSVFFAFQQDTLVLEGLLALLLGLMTSLGTWLAVDAKYNKN
ncbi:hypothetical protein [Bacillus sp. SN10]|uniref:hypothetical protein n=1 Tax=Bacillus sp. SN10 TaxID=2056493 RepID=UPI000C34167D|nr:hypothetical protein [Bacillus sp. SN10]PKJ53151.1 hypothetical protein CWE34_23705 [Bacillus sp. SN10]